MECEYCLETFEDEECLKKHKRQSKNCLKYKDVLFVCKKCKYSTVGIKNIDSHIKTCKVVKLDDNASYELLSDDDIFDKKENILPLKILERIENKIDSLLKNSVKIPKNIISSMPVHFISPEMTEDKKNEKVQVNTPEEKVILKRKYF